MGSVTEVIYSCEWKEADAQNIPDFLKVGCTVCKLQSFLSSTKWDPMPVRAASGLTGWCWYWLRITSEYWNADVPVVKVNMCAATGRGGACETGVTQMTWHQSEVVYICVH